MYVFMVAECFKELGITGNFSGNSQFNLGIVGGKKPFVRG